MMRAVQAGFRHSAERPPTASAVLIGETLAVAFVPND